MYGALWHHLSLGGGITVLTILKIFTFLWLGLMLILSYIPGRPSTAESRWLSDMGKKLKECMGELIHPGGDYRKYFDLIFWHEGLEDEKFMAASEKTDIINREIKLCGYFAIVTSDKMTAEEALMLY